MKYSDLIRFFEVFPKVSYIYESRMNDNLYSTFLSTVKPVLMDKKFPIEDICRVFNILVKISPFTTWNEENNQITHELLGRLRSSVYDVPKEHFALTVSNLIEFQQPVIATKLTNILYEVAGFPEDVNVF